MGNPVVVVVLPISWRSRLHPSEMTVLSPSLMPLPNEWPARTGAWALEVPLASRSLSRRPCPCCYGRSLALSCGRHRTFLFQDFPVALDLASDRSVRLALAVV